jgi:hypothetical protein
VAGRIGSEHQVGELRLRLLGPGGIRPGSQVEDPEALGNGDEGVASVACGIQAGEALEGEIALEFQRGAVEDDDAAVVGQGHAGCGGCGRGRLRSG